MRAIPCAAAILLLGLASEAEANPFGYCYIDYREQADSTRYVSGVIEVGKEVGLMAPGGSFREAFLDHVRSRYEPGANIVACETWETLNDARRAAFGTGTAGEIIWVRTGWLGGRAEAVAGKATKPANKQDVVAAQERAPSGGGATRANSETEYEAKRALYEQELVRQKAAVAEFERAQAKVANDRAEQAERARKAKVEWERAVAACKAGDHSACSQTPQ